MWVGEILPTYIKKIIIMKKFSVFIVLICICIGFSGCALFVPFWECLTEPYPTTYYYYGGCYHTTPPPPTYCGYYHCGHYHRPHRPKVIHTHSHRHGHIHRPNSNGGHRGSRYGRGGQQGGRHKR